MKTVIETLDEDPTFNLKKETEKLLITKVTSIRLELGEGQH